MRVYANLLGNWTDITDHGTVERGHKPIDYFKDTLGWEPGEYHSKSFEYDRFKVEWGDHCYWLDPSHIQIVDY